MPTNKLPPRAEIVALISDLIGQIDDDSRAGDVDQDREDELREMIEQRDETRGNEDEDPDLDDEIDNLIDELACMDVTVGLDPTDGTYGYQTGDNSFTGGAYGFRPWAVVTISRDSDPGQTADEIIRQWSDELEGDVVHVDEIDDGDAMYNSGSSSDYDQG
jgi:hypothetical protein